MAGKVLAQGAVLGVRAEHALNNHPWIHRKQEGHSMNWILQRAAVPQR